MSPARTALNGVARLCFLLILGLFAVSAYALSEDCTQDGGQATCTTPISTPGPWKHHLCDDAGAYFIRYAMWCTAMGGTWMGSNAPVWCVGADPTLEESELYPYAETFERLIHNVQSCSFNGQDNGWLSQGQVINSWNCWSGGPVYQNGIEVSNLREMLFTGQSYNTSTQSCNTGIWTERVMALRTRQIQTGCPDGYTLRSSRFTGQLECYSMETCPEGDLSPYDPDPIPRPLDIVNLTDRAKDAISCLAICSGQSHTALLSSAYRPVAYQDHLREVWSKWNDKLKNNTNPACAALKAKVKKEFDDHKLDASTLKPSRTSCHSITGQQPIGSCFDVNSSFIETVDLCSTRCDVYRPWPYLPKPRKSDPIHVLPY